MKKALLSIILFLIPIALALEECPRYAYPRDIPCEIRSTWKPDTGCEANFTFYNASGTNIYNTSWTDLRPYCKANYTYSGLGTTCGNSTIEDICITIQGDDENMILLVGLFLIGINILVFALPFWVKFTESEAGNYMIKRLMWIGALLLLWFNGTIFRQLASDWGLGIDNFLLGYWWIFTLGAFSCILIMCYVMVVGATKLMKEAKLKKRMGEHGY